MSFGLEKLGVGKSNQKGYCVKCRKMVFMFDIEDAVMKNKKEAWKGKCEFCGSTMYKIKPAPNEGMW
jgi:Zn finger protein HypA/HybF involved in hydrogenase expression